MNPVQLLCESHGNGLTHCFLLSVPVVRKQALKAAVAHVSSYGLVDFKCCSPVVVVAVVVEADVHRCMLYERLVQPATCNWDVRLPSGLQACGLCLLHNTSRAQAETHCIIIANSEDFNEVACLYFSTLVLALLLLAGVACR